MPSPPAWEFYGTPARLQIPTLTVRFTVGRRGHPGVARHPTARSRNGTLPMRWFVEISELGPKAATANTLCVDAPQWKPALQKARALRGDEGALSNFSIELLDDGFRAIDPMTRLRYVVK